VIGSPFLFANEHLSTGVAMRKLILFLATGFYSGYAPFAPGTAGSVVGLMLAWGVTVPLERRSPLAALALIAALFAAGCWLSGRAEKLLDQHDSSHIVIDEIVGMALTMYLCPAASWMAFGAGFALFRLFDVLKPEPAGLIDRRMRGGLAVMLDDVAAAIYANLVLRALVLLVSL
jgi:phosphatidylglycerophosphatase A